ncbi:MAG: amino acid transporter, partial [Pseudomonadota bacterium]|nr:amino acid transporter [Pseudomonadota bacterium]
MAALAVAEGTALGPLALVAPPHLVVAAVAGTAFLFGALSLAAAALRRPLECEAPMLAVLAVALGLTLAH